MARRLRSAPTVTIEQAAAQSDPTGASPINFTVVFSESTNDFATGDVTLAGTAGATTFDDSFIFNGSMDRFDFKLVGKKEIIVPYNDYVAVYGSKQDDLLKPNFLNPDLVRWELHRVWIVEATLREGKRHVYSKRTFYLDEDSWMALASDEYDGRGQLYRAGTWP